MGHVMIDGETVKFEAESLVLSEIDLPEIRLDPIAVGEDVEVRTRFDQAWARGFEVFEVDDTGYRLRRHSDGAVLPVGFARGDLRRSGSI